MAPPDVMPPATASPPAVERHVVLVAPEIHWNTGNAGRTCLGVGAALHLIRPLGFSLSDRMVRRAGLDYWNQVNLMVWDRVDDLLARFTPGPGEIALFAKKGSKSFRTLPRSSRLFLFFGSETRGLPDDLLRRFPDAAFHIPIRADIRSLNLSTSVAVALYESLRGSEVAHEWGNSPAGMGNQRI